MQYDQITPITRGTYKPKKHYTPYLQIQTKSITKWSLTDPSPKLWALAKGRKGKNTHNPETLPISSCVHPSLTSESKGREIAFNKTEVKKTDRPALTTDTLYMLTPLSI